MNTVREFAGAEAFSAVTSGQLARAEAMAREHLDHAPGHQGALTILAISLQMQRRAADAAAVFRELTERFPTEAAHWSNLGNALREADRPAEAASAFERAVELAPRAADVRVNYGMLSMQAGRVVEARAQFAAAVALNPADPVARIYAAVTAYECGGNEVAEEMLEPWRSWTRLDPAAELDLGRMLIALGQAADGERLLRRALAAAPDPARARARLIVQLERLNRLDEARAELAGLPDLAHVSDRETRTDIANARIALALRDSDPARARAAIAPLADIAATAAQRMTYYFSLAKICDRQDDIPAAIAALDIAHRAQMEQVARVRPELADPSAKPLAAAIVTVDADSYRAWPTLPAPPMRESPIFIVGFPRSGTTLLEQILDAHSSLRSVDERSFVQGVIERMPVSYPAELHTLDAAAADRLRAEYWGMVARMVRLDPGQRVVDKNPLNLMRLPAIHRLFPNAPIVLALRHPCDVLLSCYLQSFRSPHFATTCRSIGQLAGDYVDAMRAWIHNAQTMKPNVLAVRYEDLVDDLPAHVERVGAFLGLDDIEPMKAYHEHAQRKGFISTPSYAQVIEPPHKRAIGRWLRYRELFEPVLPTLRPIIEHWGYSV